MGNSGILRKVLVHSAFNSHTACTCARINCSYKGNESGAQLYDVCRSSPVHQWKGLELSSSLMYGSMGHRSASQAAQTYKCAFLPDSWHSVNQWLVDSQSKSYHGVSKWTLIAVYGPNKRSRIFSRRGSSPIGACAAISNALYIFIL